MISQDSRSDPSAQPESTEQEHPSILPGCPTGPWAQTFLVKKNQLRIGKYTASQAPALEILAFRSAGALNPSEAASRRAEPTAAPLTFSRSRTSSGSGLEVTELRSSREGGRRVSPQCGSSGAEGSLTSE